MTAYIEEDEIRQCLKIIMEGVSGYFGQRDPYTGLMKLVKIEPLLCAGTGAISENKKEENAMKVSYKGVTGELEKMERLRFGVPISTTDGDGRNHPAFYYTLEIWDPDKKCKVSFTNVPLKDVKFLGGEVTYG